MSNGRFLVTGARGFIGSWVTKDLVDRGFEVTAFDVDRRPQRISLVLSPSQLDRIHFVRGDMSPVAHRTLPSRRTAGLYRSLLAAGWP